MFGVIFLLDLFNFASEINFMILSEAILLMLLASLNSIIKFVNLENETGLSNLNSSLESVRGLENGLAG